MTSVVEYKGQLEVDLDSCPEINSRQICFGLTSCHFDSALNFEIGVEC